MQPKYASASRDTLMPVQVGIDLVHADEVSDALRAHGERYLQRVYTDAEQEDCSGDVCRLALRFAAKEAGMKALQPDQDPLGWRSIAVREDASGHPSLELTGAAAALAAKRGVTRLRVSFSSVGPLTAAIVFADIQDH